MTRVYYKITTITDFGPFTEKLVLPVGKEVQADAVRPECFNVYVERKDETGNILMLPKSWSERDKLEESKGYCLVTAAYPSDLEGNRLERGIYITLELKYGPRYPLTASIAPIQFMNRYVLCDYRITQIADILTDSGKLSGMVFELCAGNSTKQAYGFLHGISSYEEPLKYGYYVPQTGGGKRPLIIWLHGAGEGGQDPTIAYTGNKVVNLASEDIQAKFGGAYILVPQTPTFWMDNGSGQYTRTGQSRYVKALKALIDEFIAKNEAAIDTKRIYIGGCSNGGFMTMRMIIDYPDFFAAAWPVCEALYDEVISDADIEAIKHMPIWFTHARNDDVVKPEETAVPTYQRLIRAGAADVHFSLFDKVVDIRGAFTEEGEEPFEYHGHFSWIYALNDDCRLDYDGQPVKVNDREVSLMDWLALQSKS
jgi:poly(3-hydroxybutyrate) depolymerase